MSGMEKILKGIMRYRTAHQRSTVEHISKIKDNPVPDAVLFTCVDTRLLPARFTQTNPGDMFVVRNAGNIVPNSGLVSTESPATEPAVMELACVLNSVGHVAVCGHSDCKAMNLLHTMDSQDKEKDAQSPLRSWVSCHGRETLGLYRKLEKDSFKKPLLLQGEDPGTKFQAYIDVDNKYAETDKLSLLNTLVQVQNITSYPFMSQCLKEGRTRLHAFWFDVSTGEVLCFSRKQKTFVPVDESNVQDLLDELNLPSGTKAPPVNGPAVQNVIKTTKAKFSTSACCTHQH